MVIKLHQNQADAAQPVISILSGRRHPALTQNSVSRVDAAFTNQPSGIFRQATVSKLTDSGWAYAGRTPDAKLTGPAPSFISAAAECTAAGRSCRREKLTEAQEHIPPYAKHATLRQCPACKQILNACVRSCIHCSASTKPPRSTQAMIAVKLACLLIGFEMIGASYASINVTGAARQQEISIHFDR